MTTSDEAAPPEQAAQRAGEAPHARVAPAADQTGRGVGIGQPAARGTEDRARVVLRNIVLDGVAEGFVLGRGWECGTARPATCRGRSAGRSSEQNGRFTLPCHVVDVRQVGQVTTGSYRPSTNAVNSATSLALVTGFLVDRRRPPSRTFVPGIRALTDGLPGDAYMNLEPHAPRHAPPGWSCRRSSSSPSPCACRRLGRGRGRRRGEPQDPRPRPVAGGRHEWPDPAHAGARRLRAGAGVRSGHLRAAQEHARAPVDAGDLRADLRDLQDVPDHAGQVHPAARGLHRDHHDPVLRLPAALRGQPRHHHPALQPDRDRRQLRRRLVRHPDQHLRQLAHRLRQPAGPGLPRLRHPAQGRDVDRHAADQRRAVPDAVHPALHSRRLRRAVLHRLRHRRVAGRGRPPDRGRHLHEDRRHRLRPHEDRLQHQGGRRPQPRRHRRLHGRQRRRLGRARAPTASRPTGSPASR